MGIIVTILAGYTDTVLALTTHIQGLTDLFPRDQLAVMQTINGSKTSTGVFENLVL